MLFVSFRLFLLSFVFFGIQLGAACQEKWPVPLKTKVENALSKIYGIQIPISLKKVKVSEFIESVAKLEMNQHFYEVHKNNIKIGYLYVSQANSMKNVFDYMVVLSPELIIKKAKVLIYREQHGRQIGTPRWLNQFNGMGISDRPRINQEVDGISGATISATSMTQAVNKLLQSLSIVKENGAI